MSAPNLSVLMPALNTDVLTIILEDLFNSYYHQRAHPDSGEGFLDLRLVSKQLIGLVVPIGYRRMTFGSRVLECFKTYIQVQNHIPLENSWYCQTPERLQAQLNVAEYIITHTRHFLFDSRNPDLDWSWVPDMLDFLKNLKHITYVGFLNASIQYKVLACPLFRARRPELRISLGDFYHEEAMHFYPLLGNLASCTDDGGTRGDVSPTHVIQIKNMLLASPNMQVLDLTHKNSEDANVSCDIKDGEKLPPFKDLNLRHVDWTFSPAEAVNFWDWSRITHLRMTRVSIIPFLETVTPEHLVGLRTFKTDCWRSEDRAEEASRLLYSLVNKIRTLERLGMKCVFSHINHAFPAIIKHGRNLRSLALRALIRPNDDPKLSSILSIKKLGVLCPACPNLIKMDIDIKLNMDGRENARNILSTTLASFRNLSRLFLHTQMSWPMSIDSKRREVLETVEPSVEVFDMVKPMVCPWIRDLMSRKQGVEFDSLRLYIGMRDAVTGPDERHWPLPGFGVDEHEANKAMVYIGGWGCSCRDCTEEQDA